MDKVTYIENNENGVLIDYVIIDRGNGEFTSMLKSRYEEQQAIALAPLE